LHLRNIKKQQTRSIDRACFVLLHSVVLTRKLQMTFCHESYAKK